MNDLTFITPEINWTVLGMPAFLMIWAMLVLIVDMFTSDRRILLTLSLIGLGVTAALGALDYGATISGFSDMLVFDKFGVLVNWILLAGTALTLLIAFDYMPRQNLSQGEFYPLVLFATSGMLFLVQSTDLVTIFIGVETLSIALYVLTGFAVPQFKSGEAAIKYLLLGGFAAGFLVYGIALIYGMTGKTNLAQIAAELSTWQSTGRALDDPILLAGVGFVLIALGFKVSMFPFHAWTPDVYEGAPTPVTAYMSVATKGAAFAAMLRFLNVAFPALKPEWQLLFGLFAAATMAYGNIVAVAQSNLKRMLAYSSIAHAGYMLLGVLAASEKGISAFTVYLLAYTLTNLGAFAVLIALENRGMPVFELSDLRGLGKRSPLLALAMTVFMFSLAGVPPTAGFASKFGIFRAAWDANLDYLAIIGVVTSVISAFFYLRVIVTMWMRDAEATEPQPTYATASLSFGVIVAVIGIIAVGILPNIFTDLAKALVLTVAP
ncbi:NADH-quinone oxidoreductase subunit N [Herpetosiphon gulosus]|uniref:NADH-quinone oxidoreductase subunit N n=1 Tax=Herpetosiphon gulosus TaxID=1973496 RepID=A0ABP9WWR3_9CHLR